METRHAKPQPCRTTKGTPEATGASTGRSMRRTATARGGSIGVRGREGARASPSRPAPTASLDVRRSGKGIWVVTRDSWALNRWQKSRRAERENQKGWYVERERDWLPLSGGARTSEILLEGWCAGPEALSWVTASLHWSGGWRVSRWWRRLSESEQTFAKCNDLTKPGTRGPYVTEPETRGPRSVPSIVPF